MYGVVAKQDRTPVRTPAHIEQKYELDKDFKQIEQMAVNAQKTANAANFTANNAATIAGNAKMAAGNAQTRADNTYTIAETLTEATKAMFELGVNAVPNDVFVAIKSMFDGIVGRLEALEGGGLPTGYTPLEYIQSSGTQHIDSGHIIASENMRVVMKFAYTADHSSSALFGSETSGITGSGEYSICPYGTPQFFVGGSKQLPSIYAPALNEICELDVTAKNGVLTDIWNGSTQNSQSYVQKLNHTYSVAVFGNNVSGTVGQKVSMRLYSFQLYDNGSLVRDFVPCKNPDGAYGLYDKVNKQFYGNAGTGAFTGA